ncbi:MAG: isoprenylcysteine carboxylmethyltransferase family protein [Anaerolineales bacterium]|nr:isoprenylcysteine carboxylmethyltransferase family protein [Anaerolineales bacterium]
MNSSKIFPPTYLLIAIIVMLVLHFTWPLTTILFPPWQLLGIIPLGVGVMINVIAANTFQTRNTTIKPFEESTALVTGGLYQVSRNPMYLGIVLILAGVAILLGSLTPFAVIPVVIVLLDRNFIRFEEQKLAQTFGPRWVEYRRRVRRWV